MAHIGCYVPCTHAEIPPIDAIFARAGAGDTQLKGMLASKRNTHLGISTFMSEMLEMSSILHSASANSLLIIDELGRGTSSTDGFALAWALSEFLIENVKCFTLFATHFHDLGNLEKCYPNIVSNVHVKALISDRDVDALEVSLLYKVVSGVGHESLGIHVAQVVGFPSECIKLSTSLTVDSEEVSEVVKFIDHVREGEANLSLSDCVTMYSSVNAAFLPQ
ncbi:hypothetical protein DI09_4p450, partial [Mitosporidium daphniae]